MPKELHLPVKLNQANSHNCWLASLLMIYLYHRPKDTAIALQLGRSLLTEVGIYGLFHIHCDPFPTLNIINSTKFSMINFAQIYREVYKLEKVPHFQELQFDAAIIEHTLKRHGPFTVSLKKSPPNSHVVVVIGVYQNQMDNTVVKYIDPLGACRKTIGIDVFNRKLLRNLYDRKGSALYDTCLAKLPSTLFYCNPSKKTETTRLPHLFKHPSPNLRQSELSYQAVLLKNLSGSSGQWPTVKCSEKPTKISDGNVSALQVLVKTGSTVMSA